MRKAACKESLKKVRVVNREKEKRNAEYNSFLSPFPCQKQLIRLISVSIFFYFPINMLDF